MKQPKAARPRRGRVARRLGFLTLNTALAVLTVATLLLGAGVLYLKSSPVVAPAWAREMIEQRLATALPDARIFFGDAALYMDDAWRPRVRLRDVAVTRPTGETVLQVTEARVRLTNLSLTEWAVQPSHIALSGIVAQLRRQEDGRLAVSGAADIGAETQARTLGDLTADLDALLTTPAFAALKEVDFQAITLRYEDLRAGRAWTVDGARLRLNRQDDQVSVSADLALLGGGVGVATLSANMTSTIGSSAAEFGVSFDDLPATDIAAQGPAFAWLSPLRAPISGSVRTAISPDGTLGQIAATLQMGAGAVQPRPDAQPIPFESARSYFTFDPAQDLLQFDELSISSPWISGSASGDAVLNINRETGQLTDLVGQLTLSDLAANPAQLYPSAVALEGVEADFRLALNPFEFHLGRAQIADQAGLLTLDGTVAARAGGWQVALDGRMDSIDRDRLFALWPEVAATRTRDWLIANLQAADVQNVDIAIRRGPNRAPQTYLAFDYDAAVVRLSRTLPPLSAARGHLSLAENRLVITVDDGVMEPDAGGAMAMGGSSFIIPDVRAKERVPAVARLQSRSSITAALSLLNRPPLRAMDAAGLAVDVAEGRARLAATLDLTLRRGAPPQIAFYGEGRLSDVRSGNLIADRQLLASTLDVTASSKALEIAGAGTLDGLPFDMRFDQPLGPDRDAGSLSGTVTLDTDALETFGVALPPGTLEGQGQADVEVLLARGQPPQLELTSDLAGLRLDIPQVTWTKPANAKGRLRVAGTLGPAPQIDVLEISGPGLSASGEVSFAAGTALDRVRFDSVTVGTWLDVPLDLVGQGAGQPLQVVLRGGSLDLRRAAFGETAPAPGTPPLELALDRLQITDTIALTAMEGRFDIMRGLDGSFRSGLNGGASVVGRVIPQSGRSAIRLTSENAGEVLRAAGLLNQVSGGEMELLLTPVGSGGAFDGRLTVKNVTVRDAPGIAALLNAVSVVGLVNELNGDGIYFEDVEATFRLTPDQLTLTEASAVGASMGISMDGTYALDSRALSMQGVVSPVYLLNGIGSVFTRRGEGLIGFSYALNGSANAPEVSVNPLSVFTPAMFREVFRRPPPALPEVDGVSGSTLPARPEPEPRRPVARGPEGR